jgi:hypothetical protein
MRRTLWFRTLASLLAFWFPLIAGEPGVLQPCPMHGAGAAIAASLHMGTMATAHAHHAAHASSHQGSSQPAPGHNHHDCTCINCCTVAGGALRAPDAPAAPIAVVALVVARTVPGVESLARPAPEFSRPYTTGPPRA